MSANTAVLNAANGLQSGGASGEHPIMQDPRFQELVKKRNALAVSLSIVTMVIYLVFIFLVAFDKPLLATKIGGGTTSLGIVLGLVVIVSAFILTAIYVAQANGRFDDLTASLQKEYDR